MRRGGRSRVVQLWREEILDVDLRALVARILIAPLPHGVACRLRARLMRTAGLAVGERTIVMAPFSIVGGPTASRQLSIGDDGMINAGCVFDATAPITIGDRVALGHGVLITTSSHRIGAPDRRSGLLVSAAVTIGDGAWLASRVVVLPGVEIGAGAVVAAGAVVTRSVAANTLVAGVPARVVRSLDATTAT